MRVLITGVAGTGKTSIIVELKRRGYTAIDLDDSKYCAWVDKETGEVSKYQEGAGDDWIKKHRWQVIVPELKALLDSVPKEEKVFIGGKISRRQAPEIMGLFDVSFLLLPADEVIDERLRTRTSNLNNFAKEEKERAHIIKNRHQFEADCERAGAIPLKNEGALDTIVEEILVKSGT